VRAVRSGVLTSGGGHVCVCISAQCNQSIFARRLSANRWQMRACGQQSDVLVSRCPRSLRGLTVDAAENPSRLTDAQTRRGTFFVAIGCSQRVGYCESATPSSMAWHFCRCGARRCPLWWRSNSKPHRNALQNNRLHRLRCVPTPLAIELGAPGWISKRQDPRGRVFGSRAHHMLSI